MFVIPEKIKLKLRLCHLKIWPDFEGYGFTLLAQKGTPHQFVGTVDSKSPAELAGLLPGDQIIEVNGIDVTAAPHQELVKQIKVNPHQVELLVIDKESAEHCTKSGVKFSSLMSTTERITCPDKNPNSGWFLWFAFKCLTWYRLFVCGFFVGLRIGSFS